MERTDAVKIGTYAKTWLQDFEPGTVEQKSIEQYNTNLKRHITLYLFWGLRRQKCSRKE